jgi:hypothetical protein
MKSLASTLKHFRLHSDAADEAFYVDLISEERNLAASYHTCDLLPISSLWPELVSFDLARYGVNDAYFDHELQHEIVPLLKTLPATIERICLRDSDPLALKLLQALPSHLLHLELFHESHSLILNTSAFQYLPRTLETYISLAFNRMETPISGFVLNDWALLPQSLTFLCVPISEAPLALIDILPPNLTYLNCGEAITADFFGSFASKLRQLQALVFHDDPPIAWDIQHPGTVHLRHIPRITDSMRHQPSSFYTFRPELGTWVRVPQESRFQVDHVI